MAGVVRGPRTTIKRNFALVLGYAGTRFQGLQMAQEGTLTIEGVVHNALHEAGAISNDNAGDRKKVKWSSASRTDKGVHAVACVCSSKLAIDRDVDAGIPKFGEIPQSILDAWNARLPEDIRVLSAIRWGKNTKAHDRCNLREYEYLLPESALSGKTAEDLQALLGTFEGTHRFHNFVGNLSRSIKPAGKGGGGGGGGGGGKGEQGSGRSGDEGEGEGEGEGGGEEGGEGGESDGGGSRGDGPTKFQGTMSGGKRPREGGGDEGGRGGKRGPGGGEGGGGGVGGEEEKGSLRTKTKRATEGSEWAWPVGDDSRLHSQQYVRTIYRCRILPERVVIDGPDGAPVPFLVVSLASPGFALHQIRKMVGTALAVLAGHIPPGVLEVALTSPFRVHTPLAPGDALLLESVNFWDAKRDEDALPIPPGVRAKMVQYKRDYIYPHIAKTLVTPRPPPKGRQGPDELPFEGFLGSLGKYAFPSGISEDETPSWDLLLSEHKRWLALRQEVKERHTSLADKRERDEATDWDARAPKGLLTAICVHFQIVPGESTCRLQRLVSKALANGEIKRSDEPPPSGSKFVVDTTEARPAHPKALLYQDFFRWIEENGAIARSQRP